MKHGDWEVKKLGEVCDILNGRNQKKVEDINGKYPIYGSGGIMGYANDYICKAGTTIIGRKGSINKPLYVETEFWNVDTAFGLQPKECCHSRFLYYLCKSIDFARYDKGVTIPSLVKSDLLQIPVSIPSLEEQSRIVEELELLSNIIEKKRQQLSELDNLAQSIFYDMFGDPVTNEKGWEVKKLGEVCKTSSGGTPSKSHSEYYEGGIIPWLRSGEVNQMYISKTELFITEEGLANSSAKWFPENTVVIAMYGATVGQVGILCKMMTTNQAICGIFPNESFIAIYLYHFLLSKKEEYIKLASGGAQPNISQNIIRDTLVCCPKKELQQLFAQKIEAIEKQKALIKQSIAETEELFNSRMDYYFS